MFSRNILLRGSPRGPVGSSKLKMLLAGGAAPWGGSSTNIRNQNHIGRSAHHMILFEGRQKRTSISCFWTEHMTLQSAKAGRMIQNMHKIRWSSSVLGRDRERERKATDGTTTTRTAQHAADEDRDETRRENPTLNQLDRRL